MSAPKISELCKGVTGWQRNGYAHLRVHYSADPDKDEAWAAEAKKGYPTYAWRQEHEIDFAVTPGRPVYCDTDRIVVGAQLYRPWLVLFRATDFGFNMPASVYAQVEPVKANDWRVRFLREVIGRGLWLGDFLDKHLLPEVPTYFPDTKVEDFCDIEGNSPAGNSPETEVQIMNARGIWPKWRSASVNEGTGIFQTLISSGMVAIDPAGCPTLLQAVRGGYVRDDEGFPVKDGYYEHVADAARYIVVNVFRLRPQIVRGERVNQVQLAQLVKRAGPSPNSGGTGGMARLRN